MNKKILSLFLSVGALASATAVNASFNRVKAFDYEEPFADYLEGALEYVVTGFEDDQDETGTPSYKVAYTYNDAGDVTCMFEQTYDIDTSTYIDRYKDEYTYDTAGNLTLRKTSRWLSASSTWEESYKEVYEYDASGNKTSYEGFTGGKKYEKHAWDYTADGSVKNEYIYALPDGEEEYICQTKEHSYPDENKVCIKTYDETAAGGRKLQFEVNTEYNENGDEVKITSDTYKWWGNFAFDTREVKLYAYDTTNRVTSYSYKHFNSIADADADQNPKDGGKTIYTYDDATHTETRISSRIESGSYVDYLKVEYTITDSFFKHEEFYLKSGEWEITYGERKEAVYDSHDRVISITDYDYIEDDKVYSRVRLTTYSYPAINEPTSSFPWWVIGVVGGLAAVGVCLYFFVFKKKGK